MIPAQTLGAVRPPARTIQSVLVHRWARLLIPSHLDLFFLAVLVWLFAAGSSGWSGLLADADAGWHIRTGQYILDHRAVPHQDLYSFSKPGAPWYAWEWGSDVIYGALHRLAGLKGVVLVAGVVLALFATTLVLRMVLRGAHVFIALMVALLSIGSSSIHFLARPHVFTLLFLSVSMWMIESDRERPGRRIWLLVPLTALWTNLHGGFLALIAVLGIAAAGTAAEAWLAREPLSGRQWRNAARYTLLAAACGAASMVNPYGYHLHAHIVDYLRSDWIKSVVQEFQSPSFRTENMMQFEVLLIAGLIVAGALMRRRAITETLWILFFAHEALASVRHVPVFVTVAGPLIAVELSAWWHSWSAGRSKKSLPGIVNHMAADAATGFRRASLWPAAALCALVLMGAPIPWPKDFPEAVFPAAMVHKHSAEILGARVLTTDQWADYLIYTNPAQKVFVDGRSDFYGPEIGNQYLRLISGQWDWAQTLAKYDFSVALLPTDAALVQLLKTRPDWRAVDDDGKRILLVHVSTLVPSTGNFSPEPRF